MIRVPNIAAIVSGLDSLEADSQRRAMTATILSVDRAHALRQNQHRYLKALPEIADAHLLAGNIKCARLVHCRRTLDQFYYYMLKSSGRLDRGQIAYRWGKKNLRLPKCERPILMVNQLWLWAPHNGAWKTRKVWGSNKLNGYSFIGAVITAFSNTWVKESDLRTAAEMELVQNKTRRPNRSTEELVHLSSG